MSRPGQGSAGPDDADAIWGNAGGRVLAVDVADLIPPRIGDRHRARLVHMAYEALDPVLLRMIAPDLVIAPLFCRTFDALDLIQLLRRTGFPGSVLLLTAPLPNPRAVLSEIRKSRGGMTVNLHEIMPVRPA